MGETIPTQRKEGASEKNLDFPLFSPVSYTNQYSISFFANYILSRVLPNQINGHVPSAAKYSTQSASQFSVTILFPPYHGLPHR